MYRTKTLQGEFNFRAICVYPKLRDNKIELKLFSKEFSTWKLRLEL